MSGVGVGCVMGRSALSDSTDALRGATEGMSGVTVVVGSVDGSVDELKRNSTELTSNALCT